METEWEKVIKVFNSHVQEHLIRGKSDYSTRTDGNAIWNTITYLKEATVQKTYMNVKGLNVSVIDVTFNPLDAHDFNKLFQSTNQSIDMIQRVFFILAHFTFLYHWMKSSIDNLVRILTDVLRNSQNITGYQLREVLLDLWKVCRQIFSRLSYDEISNEMIFILGDSQDSQIRRSNILNDTCNMQINFKKHNKELASVFFYCYNSVIHTQFYWNKNHLGEDKTDLQLVHNGEWIEGFFNKPFTTFLPSITRNMSTKITKIWFTTIWQNLIPVIRTIQSRPQTARPKAIQAQAIGKSTTYSYDPSLGPSYQPPQAEQPNLEGDLPEPPEVEVLECTDVRVVNTLNSLICKHAGTATNIGNLRRKVFVEIHPDKAPSDVDGISKITLSQCFDDYLNETAPSLDDARRKCPGQGGKKQPKRTPSKKRTKSASKKKTQGASKKKPECASKKKTKGTNKKRTGGTNKKRTGGTNKKRTGGTNKKRTGGTSKKRESPQK